MLRKSVLVIFIFASLLTQSIASAAALDRLRGQYKSALVLEVGSGKVLHEDRAHQKADPASLVKMMVILLAMEGIGRGELRLDDTCTISGKAARIGGHQVYLKEGEVFTFEDLLKAVTIGSANDAAYAVAEHIAGSQEAFVELMNKRARQLGMRETRFTNAHGLPANRRAGQEPNFSSAHDLALLGQELMKHPQVLKWSSTQLDTFREGTFQLVNTNRRFLKRFDGADGLKTGYHPRGAGHNLVATAIRNGRRLLAVVLGAKSARVRLEAMTQLLGLGFSGQL